MSKPTCTCGYVLGDAGVDDPSGDALLYEEYAARFGYGVQRVTVRNPTCPKHVCIRDPDFMDIVDEMTDMSERATKRE